MISAKQTAAIWHAIRTLPGKDRPHKVRHAFDLVLLNFDAQTGEVLLTIDDFAAEIGCGAAHISTIMGTLVRMGVIRRERRRVAGMKGPGIAVYFVNQDAAWGGTLDVRRGEGPPAGWRMVADRSLWISIDEECTVDGTSQVTARRIPASRSLKAPRQDQAGPLQPGSGAPR